MRMARWRAMAVMAAVLVVAWAVPGRSVAVSPENEATAAVIPAAEPATEANDDVGDVAVKAMDRRRRTKTEPKKVRTEFRGSKFVVSGSDSITEELLEAYGTLTVAAAAMAYHPDEHTLSNRAIKWCPAVPLVSYFHHQGWQDESTKGGNFNILTNDKMGLAVVAFRGTDGLWDVAHDLNPHTIPYEIPNPVGTTDKRVCGRVHRGFYNQFTAIKEALLARMGYWLMIDKANESRGRAPLYQTILFTGHSLGGALAVLGSAYVANRFPTIGERIHTITYGAPNIGDDAFVQCFDSLIRHSARVENENDPIPHFPASAVTSVGSVGKTKVVTPCKMGWTLKPHKCHLADMYFKGMMSSFHTERHDVCYQRKLYKDRVLDYTLGNSNE